MQHLIYSIVLPVKDQEDQVKNLIEEYIKNLSRLSDPFELILIFNGSKDMSYGIGKKFAERDKRIKVFVLAQAGWGRAVKFGIHMSNGKYICYTNSARTNIGDLVKMIKIVKANGGVVVKASRIVREGFLRKLGSIIYNVECRLLFKTPIWDVNGTPKIFPRKILNEISLSSNGDLFDAEFMAKCWEKGLPIIEVPIYFNKRRSGKSSTTIISAIKMYIGLFQLKMKP